MNFEAIINYEAILYYASIVMAVRAALAFVTMFMVRHGDAKPEVRKGLEALDTED